MELLTPTDFNAVGDGVTDDTAAIQDLFDAGAGLGIAFLGGSPQYRVSRVVIRQRTRLIGDARLISDNSFGGDTSVLTLEPDIVADSITLDIPGGSTLQRAVFVNGRCEIRRLAVRSTEQLSLFTENLDGIVQLRGDDIVVGSLEVERCDYPVVAFNCNRLRLGQVRLDTYVRGLFLRNVDGFSLDGLHAFGLSPNSRHEPGHNGLLMESIRRAQIRGAVVEDAGEHGIRIGGPDAFESEEIAIDAPVVHRSGQCGLKVHPGPGHTVERLVVIAPMLVDSASRSTPGTNEDGLRLQDVRGARIVSPTILKSQNAVSGFDGIYIENCFDVTITKPRVVGVRRDGIRIERVAGNVNSLFIDGATIRDCGANGVTIDGSGDAILRDISLTSLFIRECGGIGVKCTTQTKTAGANQPVILQGWISQAQGGAKQISEDPDVLDLLKEVR